MATNTYAGISDGRFSITKSGQAAYHFPIKVPKGTNKMQPSLAVLYTSNQLNGLLGPGFALSGLSSITRTGQTLAQDQSWTPVQYSGEDRFALGGERLVAISGQYGADGTEYRTERDTFSRIFSYGNAGGGPEYFELTNRNGKKMIYGASASSRVPVAGGTSIRTWSLNKVIDLCGNYYEVEYETDPENGTNRPSVINYTGNTSRTLELMPTRSVTFDYENRQDQVGGYTGGFPHWQTKRLQRISTHIGDRLVRTYTFGYSSTNVREYSQLLTITEADGNGISLPPVTFTRPSDPEKWLEAQILQPPMKNIPVTDRYMNLTGDLTGSGQTDLIRAWADSNLNLCYAVFLANADGSFKNPIVGSTNCNFDGYSNGLGTVDMSGNGVSSLFYLYENNNQLVYSILKWEDSTFNVSPPVPLNLDIEQGLVPAIVPVDVNGDGKTDILIPFQKDMATFSYYLMITDGKTYTKQHRVDTAIPMYTAWPPMLMAASVTGSPMQDFIYGVQSDQLEIYCFLSNGTGFTLPEKSLKLNIGSHDFAQLIPVITSDTGLTDLAVIFQDGNNVYLRVVMSDGIKMAIPVLEPPLVNLGSFMLSAISPVNLTGDGRTDLLLYVLDGSGNTVITPLLACNRSFVPQSTINTNINTDFSTIVTPDIRGAGMNDVLFATQINGSSPSLQFQVFSTTTGDFDLVKKIDNGAGGIIDIEYLPVIDTRVYSSDALVSLETGVDGHNTPLFGNVSAASLSPVQLGGNHFSILGSNWARQAIQIPNRLVWKIKRSDGVGHVYESAMHYQDGLVDMDGRGWLGFSKTYFTDTDSSSIIMTGYHRSFPLIGLPVTKSTSWMSASSPLKTVANDYQFKNDNGVFTVCLKSKTTTFIPDLLGDPSVRSTSYTYDDYGNILTMHRSNDSNGPDLYIQRTFETDIVNWVLGLQLTSSAYADANAKKILGQVVMTYDPDTKKLKTRKDWNSANPDDSPVQTFKCDEYGNLQSVLGSNGALTTYIFGPETAYTYPNTRVRKASDTVMLTDKYEYDAAFGVMTMHLNAAGLLRTWKLDGLGRVLKAFGPGPNGQVILKHIIREAGNNGSGFIMQTTQLQNWEGTIFIVISRSFDGMGRQYAIQTSAQGGPAVTPRLQQWTLNAKDKVIRRSLPYLQGAAIFWVSKKFDPLGRLIECIKPAGKKRNAVTKIWYEGMDRITVHGQGSPDMTITVVRRNFVNGKPRITQRADGLGRVSNFEHDPIGRLKKAIPPDAQSQTAEYNSLGMTMNVEGTAFGQVENQYDLTERSKIVTYANGNSVTVSLDLLRRPVKVVLSDGLIYRVTYDLPGPGNQMGRLARIDACQDEVTLCSWIQEYDLYGRRSHLQLIMGSIKREQTRSYYPTGRLHQNFFDDKSSAEYTYDGMGQLQELNFTPANAPSQLLISYSNYNAWGKPQQAVSGNGSTRNWSYNERGQLQTVQVLTLAHGSKPQFSRTLEHDIYGRVVKVTDTISKKVLDIYTYDNAGQLETWIDEHGVLHQFSFDQAGNIQSTGSRKLSYLGTTIKVAPLEGNEYTLLYDSNGNQSKRINSPGTPVTYSYDARNLLTQVDGKASLKFFYDLRGRRLQKSGGTNGNIVYLTPNDISYYNGNILSAIKLFPGLHGVTAAVETTKGVSNPHLYFMDRDQVNSTILVTDENGLVLDSPRYEPFGRVLKPVPLLNPYLPGYGGKEFDNESGLAYFNARYFDPAIGRFITADTQLGGRHTITNALNRYAYTLNDPINLADPSGHGVGEWIFASLIDLAEIVGGIFLGVTGNVTAGGGFIGAGIGGLIYEATALEAHQSFNWGGWALGEGAGALGGVFLGGQGAIAGEAVEAVEVGGGGGDLEMEVLGDNVDADGGGFDSDPETSSEEEQGNYDGHENELSASDSGEGSSEEDSSEEGDSDNDDGGAAGDNGGANIHDLPRELQDRVADFLDRQSTAAWRRTATQFTRAGWDDVDMVNNWEDVAAADQQAVLNRAVVFQIGYFID